MVLQDQWILTAEEYADLAAFKGTTIEEELASRAQASDFIQKLGSKLKLPQTLIATGIVLMHRFYVREKFCKFDIKDLGPAAIFVASKTDEHPRKVKDVIQASFCIRFKTETPDASLSFSDDSPDYKKLRNRLYTLEKILLQTCCFDLSIKHPYNYIFRNVKLLQDKSIEDQLVQSAWNIVTESLKTTLCIRFPPKAISAAVIYFAAKREGINLCQTINSNMTDPIDAEIFPDAPKATILEIMPVLDAL